MQRLLNHAVWDHQQAQQVVREFVIEHLLDHSQVRLYTALLRHLILTTAAQAVCAVTAAVMRSVTSTLPPHHRPALPKRRHRTGTDPIDCGRGQTPVQPVHPHRPRPGIPPAMGVVEMPPPSPRPLVPPPRPTTTPNPHHMINQLKCGSPTNEPHRNVVAAVGSADHSDHAGGLLRFLTAATLAPGGGPGDRRALPGFWPTPSRSASSTCCQQP
jgi:hypothetical protein